MDYENNNYVDLICVKEKSKLRIKILTKGYYNDANCQFPRDIRKEGSRYRVSAENIKLIDTRGKWFYTVKNRQVIEILKDDEVIEQTLKNIKVFEDTDEQECSICLSNPKEIVFYPCGHYHACKQCANMVKNCPMCMKKIEKYIDRSLIG